MTKKLLLSMMLLSGASFGQSFTAANEPVIGDTRIMYSCDTAAPSYATTTGAGVTWDYSGLDSLLSSGDITRVYSVIPNTNAAFTDATNVSDIGGLLQIYKSSTTSNLFIEGIVYTDPGSGTSSTVNYTGDNITDMLYPFDLPDNITDTYSGTMVIPSLVNSASTGSSTSEIDGTGTLKLPNGVNKSNVVRHHLYLNMQGTTLGVPVTIEIKQYEYFDFAGNNLPLFSHTNVKISTPFTVLTSLNFVLSSVKPISGVGIEENTKETARIFPNPAGKSIFMTGMTGNEEIQVRDLSGKTLIETTAGKEINVEALTPGIYFLTVEKDGTRYQEKFIKQ